MSERAVVKDVEKAREAATIYQGYGGGRRPRSQILGCWR